VESACRVYRPRNPRETPLWGLLDTLYERVKGVWEERFERKYGFWRGLADEVVARYLDCGDWNSGFARVRCRRCPEEFLAAFSCRGRGLCPSCGAKRAAELGAFVIDFCCHGAAAASPCTTGSTRTLQMDGSSRPWCVT